MARAGSHCGTWVGADRYKENGSCCSITRTSCNGSSRAGVGVGAVIEVVVAVVVIVVAVVVGVAVGPKQIRESQGISSLQTER